MRNYLRIGKIISLHGIKGEIKIFPTTDDVRRFDSLDKFYIIDADDAKDEEFVNTSVYVKEGVKYFKNTCILKIKGFEKIEDVTKFIGKNIYIKREDAIKLNDNEFFVVDLIDMKANIDNLGNFNVVDVLKTKASSILVIDYNGKEVLIPFVDEFIESIDTVNSLIKIKTIEGLI